MVPVDGGRGSRERDRTLTGGPACIPGGNDGHEVNRRPQASAVLLQLLKTRWPSCDNEQYRVENKNQKLMESPGNEQRSEREGQPLGPPGIKAPLTLVGVPAEISNRNPIGGDGGTIVSVASGRPIVRNFHHWGRRGQPEMPRPAGPSNTEMDWRPMGHPKMRPAKDTRSVPGGKRNARGESRNP